MSEQDRIAIPEDDVVGWWRAHAAHLRDDPFELCIPAFNRAAYAPVDVIEPGEPNGSGDGSAADRGAADWDCWPEATLVSDGTRAFVNVGELAHHRECAQDSCITVWNKGNERQRLFGPRTFVFASSPIVSGRFLPVLVPIDTCIDRLKHLRQAGVTVDELPAFYEVTPRTADDLRAQHAPIARPIEAAQYVH